MRRIETQVVIIGGGATGAGIMRDCALRGIDCILVERDDIASGTTGRNHGLLHSGARYAVTDQHSARECIVENRTLKKIAKHCVEDTGGLFITLPEDDLDYQKRFVESCAQADIETKVIDRETALAMEPNVNPDLVSAVVVPDGTVDPFRLAASNVLDAKEHGARMFNHTLVDKLLQEGDRVIGIECVDTRTRERFQIFALEVINAAGIWGQSLCEMLGLPIKMFPAQGALLIMDYRINNLVINRCRKPADADILVPGDTIALIGTTSVKVPYENIDNLEIPPSEVDLLLAEGAKLAPIMMKTRILRAYAGVRPLVSLDGDESGRNISRGIVLLDHQERDGLKGFNTITGGKLMTYRLMAEWATDLVAKKLDVAKKCETAEKPLPGASDSDAIYKDNHTTPYSKPKSGSARYRHGERALNIFKEDRKSRALICECEMVTCGEVEYAVKNLDVKNLVDLRRRTRVGMGPCQGEMCAYRAAGLMAEFSEMDGLDATRDLRNFIEERWKGTRPICWGDALREAEFTYWVYEGLFELSDLPEVEGEPA